MKEVKVYALDISSVELHAIINSPLERIFSKAMQNVGVQTGIVGVNVSETAPVTHILYRTEETRNAAYEILKEYAKTAYPNPTPCYVDKRYVEGK